MENKLDYEDLISIEIESIQRKYGLSYHLKCVNTNYNV